MKAAMRICLFAVISLEVLCVVCASTHLSRDQKAVAQAVSALLKEAKAQDDVVLTQRSSSDDSAKLRALLNRAHTQTSQDARAALAQVFVRFLEGKVRKQDLSDEDRAKMASLLSKIKQKFSTLGSKLKNGFKTFQSKVKNAFHGR